MHRVQIEHRGHFYRKTQLKNAFSWVKLRKREAHQYLCLGSRIVCTTLQAYISHTWNCTSHHISESHAVALRHYATNRKVAGSIPDEII
jgi:hypothetical protein